MLAEEKALTLPSLVFQARIHLVERSLIILRPRKSQKARSSCSSIDIKVYEDSQSPSGSSDESSDIETPSKPRTCTAQSGFGQSYAINTSQAARSDVCYQQYCTQACLLGLARKRPLDEACPNVSAHRALGPSSHHGLDRKTLAQLMLCQLAQDPDNGCEPLGKQGARGALFRLTLDTYGYTFVAKGTARAFKANLKHEGVVYRQLNELQGKLIPVYLGNISLACPYFLDVGVRIVHMLLMSWAGDQAQKDLMSSIGRDINEETTSAVTKLRYHGVEHCDVRPPNVLWNSEGGNIMLVDLERSEILKRVPALQETSPNKRRRLQSNEVASCSHLSADLSLTISYCS
jgi:tRNA A-37 threonylcarbamoyl transferase component Bud32